MTFLEALKKIEAGTGEDIPQKHLLRALHDEFAYIHPEMVANGWMRAEIAFVYTVLITKTGCQFIRAVEEAIKDVHTAL